LSKTFIVIVCSSPGFRVFFVKCTDTDNTFGVSTFAAARDAEESDFVVESFTFEETGFVVAAVAVLAVAFEETGFVVAAVAVLAV
jgi:hypothetical protein